MNSKSSPFSEITFVKNSMNSRTMMYLMGKNGARGTKDTQKMIMYKSVAIKHENTCAGVYRNDISIPG
jgi:hypothetical protein